MQVNTGSPIVSVPTQPVTPSDKTEQKPGIPLDASTGTPVTSEMPEEQLNDTLLRWFFQQKPELGKSLTFFLTQAAKGWDRGEFSKNQHQLFTSLLSQLENLVITTAPRQEKSAALGYIKELLRQVQQWGQHKQGSLRPELQQKLETLLQGLQTELEQTETQNPKPQTSAGNEEVRREGKEYSALRTTVGFSEQHGKLVKPTPLAVPADGSVDVPVEGNEHPQQAQVLDKTLPTSASTSSVENPKGEKPDAPRGQGADIMSAMFLADEGSESVTVRVETTSLKQLEQQKLANPNNAEPTEPSLFSADTPETTNVVIQQLQTVVKTLMPNNPKMAALLADLQHALTDETVLPEALRHNLGMVAEECAKLPIEPETQWERLLQFPVLYKQTLQKTLKLLREFVQQPTVNAEQHSAKALDMLGELAANLRVQVAANQLRQENPAHQQMYFQIPLLVGGYVKTGEMLIIHEREREGNRWNKKRSTYRFYLETEHVGPVDIMVNSLNKNIAIAFTVGDESLAELFEGQTSILRSILSHHGYDVSEITCRAGTVSPLYLLGPDSEMQHQRINISV